MIKRNVPPHKKCALCFTQKPLTQFMSISKAKSEKKIYGTVCSSCLGIDSSKFHLHSFQKKLKRLFRKLNSKAGIFDNKNNKNQKEEEDDGEGGSGGKQLQQAKNVETLAKQIELANERARLAEDNLTDQKQKRLFEKHKLDLTKKPEETDKQKDNIDTPDAELDKERKKEKARETLNSEQDESDAIAGKVQRDIAGTRSSDRAARFGGLGLGFGFAQQPSPPSATRTNKGNSPNTQTPPSQQQAKTEIESSKRSGTTLSKEPTETNKSQANRSQTSKENIAKTSQHAKTELQKTASLLYSAQQATPNPNAPPPARVSNVKGASPSSASSNLFANKISGHQQATQQQNARETQSAEAGAKVAEKLANALRATKTRWGK